MYRFSRGFSIESTSISRGVQAIYGMSSGGTRTRKVLSMKQLDVARKSNLSHAGSAIRLTLLAGIAQVALLTGCDRSEIHSYRVQREFDGASLMSQSQPAPTQQTEVGVLWTVPDGWEEIDGASSVRIATFKASNGTEVAVTAFPGDVGGLVANINRWRGQVGLEPTDENGVREHLVRLDGVNVIIVDIPGESARLIGSVIDVGDGKTWFAKALGEADAVEQIRDEIAAFSASFRIDEHAGHNHGEDDHDHSSHEDEPSNGAQMDSAGWTKPQEWTVESSSSSILAAAYNAASGARITLTALMGDGGGTLANVNRWRGQLGLDTAESLEELDSTDLGDGAMMVDLIASDNSARMVAAIIPSGNQSLFFKMTGSVEAVESELERFEAFVNSQGLGKAVSP